MPAWAVAMNNELLDKYTKSMLSKGRLNEDFVKKFSNLTIAEMTPVEKAVYINIPTSCFSMQSLRI